MISWLIKRLKHKGSIHDKFIFSIILLFELLIYPILVANEEIKKALSYIHFKRNEISRIPVDSKEVLVCIHEWAGYESKRTKNINPKINDFECGLYYQLQRFKKYNGEFAIDLTLTISDREKYNYKIPAEIVFIDVSNKGFDFGGYAEFYKNKIANNLNNKYVILTNTSVEKTIEPFLDEYIRVFESNKSIGMLGIAYNTKIYQTLIRNNFNPHIEGFFIMTTADILRRLVKKNKNKFPGAEITHKLLLIRNGEIRMSKLVLKLGYKLAFVLNDGKLHTFGETSILNNGYASWKLPFGDYRLHCQTPNKITKLNNLTTVK